MNCGNNCSLWRSIYVCFELQTILDEMAHIFTNETGSYWFWPTLGEPPPLSWPITLINWIRHVSIVISLGLVGHHWWYWWKRWVQTLKRGEGWLLHFWWFHILLLLFSWFNKGFSHYIWCFTPITLKKGSPNWSFPGFLTPVCTVLQRCLHLQLLQLVPFLPIRQEPRESRLHSNYFGWPRVSPFFYRLDFFFCGLCCCCRRQWYLCSFRFRCRVLPLFICNLFLFLSTKQGTSVKLILAASYLTKLQQWTMSTSIFLLSTSLNHFRLRLISKSRTRSRFRNTNKL